MISNHRFKYQTERRMMNIRVIHHQEGDITMTSTITRGAQHG
jgi:hypothetical protein